MSDSDVEDKVDSEPDSEPDTEAASEGTEEVSESAAGEAASESAAKQGESENDAKSESSAEEADASADAKESDAEDADADGDAGSADEPDGDDQDGDDSDSDEDSAAGDAAGAHDDEDEDEDSGEDEDEDSGKDDEPSIVTSSPSQAPPADDESSAVGAGPEPEDDGIIEVRYFGTTDVGLIREHNEDNLVMVDLDAEVRWPMSLADIESGEAEEKIRSTILGERGLVLAVCDGMGGAAAGEVASQMAVDTVHEVMQSGNVVEDRDMLAHRLVFSIEEAGARIFSAAKMDRSRRGMGTTSTVAGLIDKVLFVGQVGDSRCYILRDKKLTLITKDQSLVNQLIEAGQLTEEEAEQFEHSNIILQALGTTEEVTVDLTFIELRRGDRIMLCSDGLSGLVHNDMIEEVMAETSGLEDVAYKLIELANAGGGHDNITCIVADFDGDGLGVADGAPDPVYMQYPLPPLETPVGSSVPPREPTIKTGVRKPGADVKRPTGAGHDAGSASGGKSMMPMLFVALVLLAIVAYFMMSREEGEDPDAEGEATPSSAIESDDETEPALAPVVPPESELIPVEVATDIVGAELFIDGESHGPLDDNGENTVELEEGAYQFEARLGGSAIASELVTVEPGVMVELLLPAGEMDATDVEGDEAVAQELVTMETSPTTQMTQMTQQTTQMTTMSSAPRMDMATPMQAAPTMSAVPPNPF